ncbi:MAG TPA: alanine--glyoxylate aminotransferase family protein [Vicinamibacterales bacterium]|nr:alanine--glyoxylate aminotransferase family protein [Vicinamibacterales bacterium]
MSVPERLLLGPGPSPVSARVMQALASPVLSHLDPYLLDAMDDLRRRLARIFDAAAGSTTLAISGTGTAAMEAAVANVTRPGASALVVVTGYFGDRLAQMFERYGATVRRLEVEWGRACDPAQVEEALRHQSTDLVGIVHAETSTGVLNPVDDVARVAARAGSLLVADAVTSLGGMPVRVRDWGGAVCYSCAQKGLGAPSGLSPITFSPEALARRVPCRSFYLDLSLLEDYWTSRKYHHTIAAPLVLALREAATLVEEEGLDARFDRHRSTHDALVEGLDRLGLTLLPAAGERLWTLNAVRVPAGVDDAKVRRALLEEFDIEIGAGLGPLAGRIWRVGLMGSGSTGANALRFLSALSHVLERSGYRRG